MVRLTRSEFKDALQKGKGRIILHLREHGATEFQDDILQACLHNLVYDAQCEDRRSDWLMSIIDITGKADYFRRQILNGLTHSTDFWEVHQLMDMASAFGSRGSSEARRVIYEKFDKQEFNETWLGGKQILSMDGMAGILHVAEIVGKRMVLDPEFWEDGLFSEACHRLGKDEVMTTFRDRAQKSANVQAYLDAATKQATQSKPSPRTNQTLRKILSDIDAGYGEFPGLYLTFGKRADAKDLEVVFVRLLAETKTEQLLRCLWVFRRRAMPRLEPRLFHLAESQDKRIQNGAIAALAQMQDPSIRDLAIRLLREQPQLITREALTLLIRNYLTGDHKFIENALFVPENIDTTHSIGFNILELAKSHKDSELATCLEWVYENSPCSNCRQNALRGLLERNRATNSVLLECTWDCCERTRTLARNALAKEM